MKGHGDSVDSGSTAHDSVSAAYEAYRQSSKKGWGLAWYLSAEICRRYYSSHGIAPYVLERSGLGYYGIQLQQVSCSINDPEGREGRPLGRFTMAGNVENWLTGSPGDHGCQLEDEARRGERGTILLQRAIRHLELPPVPSASHTHCHHKRRGQSFVLLWEVAALIALQHEGHVTIWNHSSHTEDLARRYDPQYPAISGNKERPNYLLFESGRSKVLVRGDGQVLLPVSSQSLWERYMQGESAGDLAEWIKQALQATMESE